MRSAMILTAVTFGLLLVGCQSTEKGVKTNYMTQWTMVNADTAKTTQAAKAVFQDEGLKEINASSTNVDGTATAKKADGTKVTASVQKKSSTTSELSVNVGKMGDPALGAELAKKIKDRAEK